jgi:lipid-A-disaccharide synthase
MASSPSATPALRVAIVAGETSGDALGAALIEALRARIPDLEALGVPGPRMRAAGCEMLADAHQLSVMGLFEVLPHLPRLLRLRARLTEQIAARHPDVFIGVDYQQFNLGLARRLKSRGLLTVQYVSPQVWAWRQGRVRTIGRAFDLVLCLLPFEPDFYREHAVLAQFVGHPLADQIPMQADRGAARAALGLDPQATVIALLPGSRLGEVQRLARPFLRAAALLMQRRAQLVLIAPMAGAEVRRAFEQALAALPSRLAVRVLDGQARMALMAADAAIVASGTATLEALLCRCPMVVAYRFASLTALLLRALRMVRLPYFALPNLLAGEPLAPEFLQEAVRPEPLAQALERLLDDGARRQYLLQRFQSIHATLQKKGAALAAEAVLQLLRARTGRSFDIEHADRGGG